MKKHLLLFNLLAMLLTSCAVNPQKHMDKLLNEAYIGMSDSEFQSKFKEYSLVSATDRTTVYEIEKRTYHDIYGWRSDYRYFYFVDGKISTNRQGGWVRATDYKIEIK